MRHAPQAYGLKLDKNGFAELDKVLDILKSRFRKFKREDLLDLVENDPKGRFEITSNKIRATYGHSIEVLPKGRPVVPPEILYHGTSRENAQKILGHGLKPMGRQFVHLSSNQEDGIKVGLRHSKNPVILKIMAKEASASGIEFFKEGALFLAKFIPKDYIKTD